MRIANVSGRVSVVREVDGTYRGIDVETASRGRFAAEPQSIYERWAEFGSWAAATDLDWDRAQLVDLDQLGSPAPRPVQVFAIGMNYREHATEIGLEIPQHEPSVFTKFPSCITGPRTVVCIEEGSHTDWEVELTVIIGRRAHHATVEEGLSFIAGYTVGQDISERTLQMAASPPQFSLAKSLPGFGPVGPWLVTLDEFDDPNDVELSCTLNGEEVQTGRTRDLIFSVPRLIAKLSASVPLLPGDVIFTGTPPGVGMGRTPQRWLGDGDDLVSKIEGIGEIHQTFRFAG